MLGNVIIESGSNNQPIQEGSAWKMRRLFLVELQIEINTCTTNKHIEAELNQPTNQPIDGHEGS